MGLNERLEIWTLGGLTIKRGETALDGLGSHKAEALLVYLASTGRPHPRPVLADLLWDAGPERRVMNSLRVTLTHLRRELAPYLTITRETVAFNPASAHWVDVNVLAQGLAEICSEQGASGSLCPAGLDRLAQHLQLYRGDFLQGFHLRGGQGFAEWLVVEQERWRLQVLDALRELVEAALSQGRYPLGLVHVARWLELDAFNEAAHRLAMQLYARNEQWAHALQQFEICKQVLDQELGLPPAMETIALYEAIKARRLPSWAGRPDKWQAGPVRSHASAPCLANETAPQTPPLIFVGRERELAVLTTALDSARNGAGQLRFVIGGAGRGKSMLVQAFARQAQAADSELLVVYGYGHAHTGQGDPYLPWRELLAMLTGDVETGQATGQTPSFQARRLQAAMPVSLPALVRQAPALIKSMVPGQTLQQRAATIASPETPWVQRLNALVTSEFEPKLEQRDIYCQYTALLKTIASQQPLLIILEDLHWADPASCGLLFHLSRHLSDSPILLLGSYRPEEIAQGEERHPLAGLVDEWKRQHGNIWLDLGRVSEAEGRQFVADYLNSQPHRLDKHFRDRLYRQTGGHPLFTAELVQAMQERGELSRDEAGLWVVDQPIDWQRLPARVEGVIETRIHRLDEALQTTLNIASVEGERFTAEDVAQVQGLAERTLVQQLSQTLDKQHRLVAAQNSERLEPDGQRLSRYRFRHHLFQQYLYQNLDVLEKTYLHEAVGNALEAFYGDQADRLAAQLAYHFRQAGVASKAVGYLLQAGQQAMGLGAYLEAITQLKQGHELLETMPDSPQRARQELSLQLLLGSALQASEGYSHPEAGRALRRAKTLCDQVGNAGQSFRVLWLLGFYYRWQGELQASHQLGTQLLELAVRAEDSPQLMLANWAAGWDLMGMGELAKARTHLEQASALYDPQQHRTLAFRFGLDPGVIAQAHLACTLWLLGYPEQALARSEAALRLARELDHPSSQAFVQIVLIQLPFFLRDFEAVHARVEMCHRLATEYGLSHLLVVGAFYHGAVLVRRGQVETGLADMERSIKELEASRAVAVEPGLVELAAAYGLAGRPEAGLSVLAQVTGGPTGIRCFDAEIHRLRGELLEMQGAAPDEVETHYWQAIQVARQKEARSWELRATVSLARLWQAQGKHDEAHKMLAEIYHWFSEGFETRDLVEARQLLETLAVTETNVVFNRSEAGESDVVDSSPAAPMPQAPPASAD